MDHTTHERLNVTELTESNLIGAPIYGADDEKIGSVSHLHGSGPAAQVIVDVGGFLGIGAKPVALPVSLVEDAGPKAGREGPPGDRLRDRRSSLCGRSRAQQP